MLDEGQEYEIIHGDCVMHMATLPPACFDMAVFSPPFPALYAYSSEEGDIGNSEDLKGEAKLHLSFSTARYFALSSPVAL